MHTKVVLHKLSDFIDGDCLNKDLPPSYWYSGICSQTGQLLKLPRTLLVEAIAHGFMRYLATERRYSAEGKMYGVLLVELPSGEQRILKAFSGMLFGGMTVDGWVPPIPGRDQVALEEAQTLAALDTIKQEIITLTQLPERQQYETLSREFELQLQEMRFRHQERKLQRHEKRQLFYETLTGQELTFVLEQLDAESCRDGIEQRQLKRQRDKTLHSIRQVIDTSDVRIRELKQRRKELSRLLQAQMHAAYSLTNFSGKSLSLQELMPRGSMPTGTGDCCAPKLLHYAATHDLKPLAMAEFWWGFSSTHQDKIQGEFYGACANRCQPLMGFLLSGLPKNNVEPSDAKSSLTILYEDEWLIAVDKPAGLLSVPGRYRDRQDSVVSRLRHLLPNGMGITAVHRLDQETSGILLLARDQQTHRQLSQQFQQRLVHKVYEAVLSGRLTSSSGVIDLPLWGDPQNRPYQHVDWQRGKPSLTRFQVMAIEGHYTRVEFIPLTGRTHQLRVHAADARGLGIPILGDRLYECSVYTTLVEPKDDFLGSTGEEVIPVIAHRQGSSRLHLHARELCFQHPQLGETMKLHAKTPF